MARHWSAFVKVTDKQARALDKMADAHGRTSGHSLLIEVSGCSSSKLSKADRLTVQRWVDECFRKWGRDATE